MTRFTDEKDDVLVELTLLGDEKAYEELVTRHESAVKGTAYRVTGNEYSAEDAAQDAFVSAWIKLDSLRERDKFRSWVCSIAKNCARSLVIHYSNTAPDISLSLLEDTDLAAPDESGLLSLLNISGMSEQERDEKLYEAVGALGEKIRETVNLHYFGGLSVAEIAEKLSVPQGTVKWRLSEGRKQLRKGYGIMEKTYNENEPLVARVMRQVEELKLWGLKNDKKGFEEDYNAVLSEVEALEESAEKQHALADVLLRGWWWLPGVKNDKTFARIKEAAEKSHNEDVMQSVMAVEFDKYSGQKSIDYRRDTQIPYLEKNGFRKALGYVLFWLGVDYFDCDRDEESLAAFRRVTEILKPTDVYYANALAAIEGMERRRAAHEQSVNDERLAIDMTGEVYRVIGGRLYFWQQPGFDRGGVQSSNGSVFWNCARCDSLIFDPAMKPGDTVTDTSGKMTLTCRTCGVSVETPAGNFDDCTVFVCDGNYYRLTHVESWFCPGVGIVRQTVNQKGDEYEWVLSSYRIKGGEGLLPLAAGNRWMYSCTTIGYADYERENRFEVTAYENGTAVLSHLYFARLLGYRQDSWEGAVMQARNEYCAGNGENEKLIDVSEPLRRAAALAGTKRQKRHTAIFTEVLERILTTDPAFNPAAALKGRWNFFDVDGVETAGGKVCLNDEPYRWHCEWKDMGNCGDAGYGILYNFLYDMLNDAAGCVWSEEWIPGYHIETDGKTYGNGTHFTADVTGDEIVTVPAGRFENCRRISFELKGLKGGWAYRGGKKEYWFAPGVGIVRFRGLYKKETLESVWELTAYEGTGEGYFPVGDGFFRHYEPQKLTGGWHGSVEYTFDADETGIILFRNALGNQDIADYNADEARLAAEKAAKEQAEKETKQK